MARKYTDVVDGRWYRLPLKAGKYIACCDCGLTHRFLFRVTSKGVLMVSTTRHPKETKLVRRRFARTLPYVEKKH